MVKHYVLLTLTTGLIATGLCAGQGQEQPFSAAFSHNGDRIVTTSADGTTRIWNAATGELVQTIIERPIPILGELPRPGAFAGLQNLQQLQLTPQAVRQITGEDEHAPIVNPAERRFTTRNGMQFFTIMGNLIILWDAATGHALAQAILDTASITGMRTGFSNDHSQIFTVSPNGSIRLLDTTTGETLAESIAGEIPPTGGGAPYPISQQQAARLLARVRTTERARSAATLTQEEKEDRCPICLSLKSEVAAEEHAETPCCHRFICRDDLAIVQASGQRCPLCRGRIELPQ